MNRERVGDEALTRTFRNRHTVPTGWVVRDDGVVYYKDGFQTKNARHEAQKKAFRESRAMGHPWWLAGHMFFLWWDDPDPRLFRERWTHREHKAERKIHYRSYRAKMKNLIRHERYDEIVGYRKTEGWLTW
jgi:hypothetical protein